MFATVSLALVLPIIFISHAFRSHFLQLFSEPGNPLQIKQYSGFEMFNINLDKHYCSLLEKNSKFRWLYALNRLVLVGLS